MSWAGWNTVALSRYRNFPTATACSTAKKGQIFLDPFNPILDRAIRPRLLEGKREPCELNVSDFDDAMYTVEVRCCLFSVLLSCVGHFWGCGTAGLLPKPDASQPLGENVSKLRD